ncbi:hypothetical protein RIF29_04515 [Crotalaria pallida]|uniref:SLC26A/SulP transporter domain-containing protein n=1 Tax=Crotalaria pallida TaxID=3830 RepID=A0AAN9PAE6_CROPI
MVVCSSCTQGRVLLCTAAAAVAASAGHATGEANSGDASEGSRRLCSVHEGGGEENEDHPRLLLDICDRSSIRLASMVIASVLVSEVGKRIGGNGVGSFSRSAVNFMAGCQTAVSNIVMSIVVVLTLLFITPLFKYTPNAILAAIIISAVIGLIHIDVAILIWKIDKFDFIACMGAFFGVVFVSVEIGLLIVFSISFAKILLRVTWPRTAILGKIPRTAVYRNTQQYPEATKIPGVLIVDLNFDNHVQRNA